MSDYELLKRRLEMYGQEHLIQFYSELNSDQHKQLLKDINDLNLEDVNSCFEKANATLLDDGSKLDDRLKPIPSSQNESVSRADPELLKHYEQEGLLQISEGNVGVLLMAGGQGTRLGISCPKGMFDVGLPSKKTLFQIQAERIRRLQQLAKEATSKQGKITWYIMTSEHTMKPTMEFFNQNNYFGLEENDVVMFEQGSLPCYDFEGKILLDTKSSIARAPDGNGGLYRALRDQNILADIEKRDIKYLHAHSVDNILIKVADPVFIGYCVLKEAECAAKVVEKTSPSEAVGVVCMVDEQYQVVEYSEITSKTAEMRNSDGRLTFNAGNICNHFFTAKFLRDVVDKHEGELKLHVAKKKIPFVDNKGERVVPDKPNGIKIEKFVFDVFQFADNFVTLEVPREVEFSALKNADLAGKDCPSTARKDIYTLHKRYIEAAGGIVSGDVCEISPLLSYAGENIEHIVAGKTMPDPCLLDEHYINGYH